MPDPAPLHALPSPSGLSQPLAGAGCQRHSHTCHWPGCHESVPVDLWGCPHHWNQLPREIRERLRQAYLPEFDSTCRATAAYISAVQAARAWIKRNPPQKA